MNKNSGMLQKLVGAIFVKRLLMSIIVSCACVVHAQIDTTPRIVLSPGMGVATWTTVISKPGESTSIAGLGVSLNAKIAAVKPQLDVVLGIAESEGFCIWCDNPRELSTMYSFQLGHTIWWKYGYVAGAVGLMGLERSGPGDSLSVSSTCGNCWAGRKFNTLTDFSEGFVGTEDMGFKGRYFGVGLRSSLFVINGGESFSEQLHVDLMLN